LFEALRIGAREFLGLFPIHIQKDIDQLTMSAEPQERYWAALRLGHKGHIGAQAAIPHLLDALTDPWCKLRWVAALALGQIGYERADVLAALTRSLEDEHPEVREAAAAAIKFLPVGYYPPLPSVSIPNE
jgi:HEAT repeat protein